MLLRSLDSADDTGISSVKKDIAAMESALKKLEEQETKYSACLLYTSRRERWQGTLLMTALGAVMVPVLNGVLPYWMHLW